jgi:hypothetical protein
MGTPLLSPQKKERFSINGSKARSPKYETYASPVIALRRDGRDVDYYPKMLNRDASKAKAIVIKSSIRWIDTFKTPNGGLSVPLIDRLGFYTGYTCYKWSCDPRSLITTVVATISKRLLEYCRKHNKHYIVKRNYKRIVGAACYYAFTKNSYFWDRILFFSRDLEKYGNQLHKLRLFFSSKWDDNKRFVYSQVIFQTNWLLFRALGPRDKSQFYLHSKESESYRFTVDSSPSVNETTKVVRDLAYAMSSMQ